MSKARELADFVAAGNPLADGSITFDEIADGNLTITSGTIKLDGNYPVGTNNVALGDESLRDLTTGGNNTALGRASLTNIEDGSHNTGVGQNSVTLTTSGSYNTGVGSGALQNNTTASNNTAVGYQAGYSNTTGFVNTAVGQQALKANTTGTHNVAIGVDSLLANTTGGFNTVIGVSSGAEITTGTKNTIIGRYNGNQGGLDIRTASNYIVLSNGDGNYSAYGTAGAWYKADNTTTWSTVSDGRIKENIAPLFEGLSKILALNPVEFDYILSGDHDVSFIAQEYREVFPEQVVEQTAIGDEIKALTNNEPLLGLKTNLVPYLVKAIQEQQATITALQTRIEALENA